MKQLELKPPYVAHLNTPSTLSRRLALLISHEAQGNLMSFNMGQGLMTGMDQLY